MTRSEIAADAARRLGAVGNVRGLELSEAVATFATLGWAMSSRWHYEGTLQALEKAAKGASPEALDEAITQVWNTDNVARLRHAAAPLRGWANNHLPLKQLLWDRVGLIEKAIDHHMAGAYEASIPILLAQIDGLSFDLTGKSFFSKRNRDPYLDDETVAGMETNLPVVRKLFQDDVTESGRHGNLSRHGVLHGRDLAYATRVNSTKTIVLVAALAEYLPRIATNTSAEERKAYEVLVAGSKDLDSRGRLVDDRHVSEVQNFAYEFDSAYAKSLLLSEADFDVEPRLGEIAGPHSLDPASITLGQDDVGVWWHYTVPAGQTLGYAARPSTHVSRRHPDVWRWDSPAAPEAPPWEHLDGWRSDDDLPMSPNWEPQLIE